MTSAIIPEGTSKDCTEKTIKTQLYFSAKIFRTEAVFGHLY